MVYCTSFIKLLGGRGPYLVAGIKGLGAGVGSLLERMGLNYFTVPLSCPDCTIMGLSIINKKKNV